MHRAQCHTRMIALFISLAALGACHKNKEDGSTKATDGGGRSRRGGGPVVVRIADAVRQISPRVVYAMAPLEGYRQADVFSVVAGRIAFFGAKEGDPVSANQILFRVDRSDPGETYRNAPVLSPISGWVGRWRLVSLGEQITTNDPVVTIVDDRSLKAIIYLPASDWIEVTPDTKITASLGEQNRAAKIATIARAADLTSGRGSITVNIDNAKRDWRSGMYARFRFELSPRERIIIKASSLIITDQGAFVYTVEGDKAKRVAVKFQMMDSDTVEITEGLGTNSKIVTAGANLLGDQSPVKIVE